MSADRDKALDSFWKEVLADLPEGEREEMRQQLQDTGVGQKTKKRPPASRVPFYRAAPANRGRRK